MKKEFQVLCEEDLPKNKTILIFSPHPDDTSICMGGTTHLLGKKNRVISVVMTSGHRAEIPGLSKKERVFLRENEARKEARLLGVEVLFLKLDLYDAPAFSPKDKSAVARLFEIYRPEFVFSPHFKDPHPTHKRCAELIQEALHSYCDLHPIDLALWYYESPWALFDREDYNCIVPLPKAVFTRKVQAIRAHVSQNSRTPYEDIATCLAKLRATIIPEQTLAGYGRRGPKLEPYVELFSVFRLGAQAKLVESFSGIRGIFRKGLTHEVAENYGTIYGNWLKHTLHINPKVVVGMDTRASGPALKSALIAGLTRAHCHIFDIGVATTPLVQFEVRNRKCDGGVIITASHNEPEWNGFKFLWQDGSCLKQEQMHQIISNYHAQTKEPERPYVDHYLRFLKDWIGEEVVGKIRARRFKIVVDPNGGAVLVLLQKLFDLLGMETITLNMRQGDFTHPIEPTYQSLKHLIPIIKKYKADFGVAWDCDGDRLEVMFPNGELLSGHYILALLVDQVLKKSPNNKTVVINAATSGVVRDVAKRHGAKVYETDVGEAKVVAKMQEVDACVGGEGSAGGGIIPPSRCRDGVMTLLKILEKMVEEKKTLLELLRGYPQFHTRQSNIRTDASRIAKIQKEMLRHFDNATPQRIEKSEALKLEWKDKTFLWLRESKTERDLLRLLVDSPDGHKAQDIFRRAMKIIDRFRLDEQTL